MKRGRRISTLMDTAPVVAKALSAKLGVKVHMGAAVPTACTDGNGIWIPYIDPDDEAARDMVMGFIDHEAGHVKETDFKVDLNTLMPALVRVVQSFEDIRQEAAFSLRFPGVRSNINRLLKRAHDKGMHGDPDRFDGFESVLFWMNNHLRLQALGMTSSEDFAKRARAQLDLNCPGAAEKLLPLMAKVPSAEDTSEVVEIADAVLDKLKEIFPEEPPKDQSTPEDSSSEQDDGSGDDDQADDADQGDDQDQGGQSPSDTDDQSGQGQSDQDSGDSGDGDDDQDQGGQSPSDSNDQSGQGQTDQDSDESGNGDDANDSGQPAQGVNDQTDDGDNDDGDADGSSGKGAGSMDPDQSPQAQQRKIAQQIRDPNAELAEVDMGDLIGKEIKASENGSGEVSPLPHSPLADSSHIDPHNARKATSRLRAKLVTLLDTHRETPHEISRRGRKIDDRYLTRVAFQDPRIFVTPVVRVELDTYVHILVDGSGSMGQACGATTLMDIAMQSAFACCLAMESIQGVTREASVFNGAAYGSVGSLVKVGERARPEKFPTCISGGTPLAQSLMSIAPSVALNRAARRIVIVMTDGDPDDVEDAQKVIDLYLRTGIEMVGVGIRTMSVQDLFPRHQVINDVSDLPAAMTSLLGSLLTRQAA